MITKALRGINFSKGVKVARPTKGIFISNGKKVIIK